MKNEETEIDPVHSLISNQVKMWKAIFELDERIKVLEKQKG